MKYLIAATLTAAFLGACDLTGTRQRSQQPALLRLNPEDSIDFIAPDTVLINANFNISVTTFGGSCDIKGPTDVLLLADGSTDFRPFNVTEIKGDQSCPVETRTFAHTGTLSVPQAGPKTITLWGRDWSGVITSRVKTVIVK